MRLREAVEPMTEIEITCDGVFDFVGTWTGAIECADAVRGNVPGHSEFDNVKNVGLDVELWRVSLASAWKGSE